MVIYYSLFVDVMPVAINKHKINEILQPTTIQAGLLNDEPEALKYLTGCCLKFNRARLSLFWGPDYIFKRTRWISPLNNPHPLYHLTNLSVDVFEPTPNSPVKKYSENGSP